jgi:hypothetical protein
MVRTKEPRNRFKGIHSARLCIAWRDSVVFNCYIAISRRIFRRGSVIWRCKMVGCAKWNTSQTKAKQAVTILVTKQSIVVDPDQDLGQAQWPQYKKKWGQSCFEFAGLWFSLGRAEDFPGAWKSLTGAWEEKKIKFSTTVFFQILF